MYYFLKNIKYIIIYGTILKTVLKQPVIETEIEVLSTMNVDFGFSTPAGISAHEI